MEALPTILVISVDHAGAEVLINERDFDAARHTKVADIEAEAIEAAKNKIKAQALSANVNANKPAAAKKPAAPKAPKAPKEQKEKEAPKDEAPAPAADGETPEGKPPTKPVAAEGEEPAADLAGLNEEDAK